MRPRLEQLAHELPWTPALGLCFESIAGDVQSAVAARREHDPASPIGVLAGDEEAVLAALSGGADEAALANAQDPSAFAVFIDRLELRARLRAEDRRLHETFAHAEKLTALGTLVAGIGHEINNPLSAMLLSIEAARRYLLPGFDASWELARALHRGDPLPDGAIERLERLGAAQERGSRDASRIFDDIGDAADSIASIVRDLRVFARSDPDEPFDVVSLEEIVDHALRLVGRELFHHALLERDYPSDLPKLLLPRNRVTQVIVNVLINALHAIRECERPVHRVRISARADEEFVALAISDTGGGIPADSITRIFDPFYTTKRKELGTGLGLSISREIMRRIGGDLTVESVYGDGATFLCFLPIPAVDSLRPTFPSSDVVPRGAHHLLHASVMVVDDDERVLRSYVRLLNPDHRLLIAQDGRDAIDLLESGSEPDIILLELDLPGVDGRRLLGWLAEHRPRLRRRALVVTSASAQARYEDFLQLYDGPVLHKPVRPQDLLSEIARLAG